MYSATVLSHTDQLFLELAIYFTHRRRPNYEIYNLLINMATTRRYSITGRGRPPLSAHSHPVNSISRKIVDGSNISSQVIKAKTPQSPAFNGSKTVLCTPDVYSKDRSVCPSSRPQVCRFPMFFCIFLPRDLLRSFLSVDPCSEMLILKYCCSFFL